MTYKFLIVGLGNPGKEYELTRHNIGFMFVDYFVNQNTSSLLLSEEDRLFHCMKYKLHELNRIQLGFEILLLKPLLFMNRSGGVVKKFMDKNEISSKQLIVIYDDLDLKFGEYKIIESKAPKQHNGVNSIIESLGTKEFLHIRIGVDARLSGQNTISGMDYVLTKFSKSEQESLVSIFAEISTQLISILG